MVHAVNALLFAFGSNLNVGQMHRRAPSWHYVASAKLFGHRLTFAGWSNHWGGAVATFEPFEKRAVRGVIYRVSFRDLFAMDRAEGAPLVYDRLSVRVRADDGTSYIAQTYQLVHRADEPGIPSPSYLATISSGYRLWKFDVDALARAAFRGLGTKKRREAEACAARWGLSFRDTEGD